VASNHHSHRTHVNLKQARLPKAIATGAPKTRTTKAARAITGFSAWLETRSVASAYASELSKDCPKPTDTSLPEDTPAATVRGEDQMLPGSSALLGLVERGLR
jgi:hypothetical protein